MPLSDVKSMFYVDTLSIIVICLVNFIGIVVYAFATRYMHGDSLYYKFRKNLIILLSAVIVMSIADNLIIFLGAWLCCNLVLTRLIAHKTSWKAANASSKLATHNFLLGFSFIGLAFYLLYRLTDSLSIQNIIHNSMDNAYMLLPLCMLIFGAMTQSAILPFNRWLISSLNAPTPVSALMHAGVVNGGGLLLTRFAPLYFNTPSILNMIFVVGLITALLGTLWKLMQNDVKRMLACSTMGQMGFMFVQIGLGFFASAIAHFCWHGLFKAYLFLASGSAAQEKRVDLNYPPRTLVFIFSLMCGLLASYVFVLVNKIDTLTLNTYLILIVMVLIAGTQLSLTILRDDMLKKLPLAIFATALLSCLYAINIHFFEKILSPTFMQAQPLNFLHVIGLILATGIWLLFLFLRFSTNSKRELSAWVSLMYVKALNDSQPHPATITSYRKGYDYV